MKALFNIERLATRALYILIAFVSSVLFVIPISASPIDYEQAYHSYSSIDLKIEEETSFRVIENGFANTCKSESDLVDYRNRATSTARIAAKGGGSLVNLTEETFSQALFKGAENVGGYSVYGTKGLVGSTFNRNIFLLEASGGKSLSGFRSFVGGLEAEALGTGANKISIYGSSVINKGFLNPNIAGRFGYSFEQSGSGVILQKVLK
jgi:hypothetical protein